VSAASFVPPDPPWSAREPAPGDPLPS